jgi:hypothetical protein
VRGGPSVRGDEETDRPRGRDAQESRDREHDGAPVPSVSTSGRAAGDEDRQHDDEQHGQDPSVRGDHGRGDGHPDDRSGDE